MNHPTFGNILKPFIAFHSFWCFSCSIPKAININSWLNPVKLAKNLINRRTLCSSYSPPPLKWKYSTSRRYVEFGNLPRGDSLMHKPVWLTTTQGLGRTGFKFCFAMKIMECLWTGHCLSATWSCQSELSHLCPSELLGREKYPKYRPSLCLKNRAYYWDDMLGRSILIGA